MEPRIGNSELVKSTGKDGVFRFNLRLLWGAMTLASLIALFLHDQTPEMAGVALFLAFSAVCLPAIICVSFQLTLRSLGAVLEQRSILPLIHRAYWFGLDALWAIWLILVVSVWSAADRFGEPKLTFALPFIILGGTLCSFWIFGRFRKRYMEATHD